VNHDALFAHTPNEEGEWHDLRDHLRGVAERAKAFGAKFGAADWAELAGWWHDLGKANQEFQEYLQAQLPSDDDAHLECGRRIDHSTAGAIHAVRRNGVRGRILAYLIAGHHAGLPDWFPGEAGGGCLESRLHREDLHGKVEKLDLCRKLDALGHPTSKPRGGAPHLWIRMLYSCLVDADFLDTGEHFRPEQEADRGSFPP